MLLSRASLMASCGEPMVHHDFGLKRFVTAVFWVPIMLSSAGAQSTEPAVPAQYKSFFAHYADSRAMPDEALRLVSLSPSAVGRSFALIAGVTHYPNMPKPEDRELPPAAEDLRKLVDYLINYEYFDEVVVLKDDEVTLDNLAFFLQSYFPDRLKKFPKSRFLFAYSGHGFLQGSSSYVLTSAADSFEDRAHSINLANLKVLIDDIGPDAFQVLVLLNSCNSGSFLKRHFGAGHYEPKYSGAYAITGGTTKELTWSYPDVGSGSVFFEKFFAGLGGVADTFPNTPTKIGDGIITVDELYSYLRQEVQLVTNNAQTPQWGDISANGSSGSFFFLSRQPRIDAGLISDWTSSTSQVASTSMGKPPTDASWPPNAIAGGSYVVTAKDQAKVIPILRLPDNFTLKFDHDVSDVRWLAGTLEFGRGVTIDLSPPEVSLPPGPNGADASGQPTYGVKGTDGSPGGSGRVGASGTSFSLVTGKTASFGSIWIKTDGGLGGPGGRGGNGQLGGGFSCGNLTIPHTNGGNGGSGGRGGSGGSGGSTAKVSFSVTEMAGKTAKAVPSPHQCGKSQRPQEAGDDDGSIVIFGLAGCGGPGGPGGAAGPGGDEGQIRSCPFQGDVQGGRPGPPGPPGPQGLIGDYSPFTQ
jgi:hypothetical protein